jgi:NAD(P)-dependent dehydrogenase (short-subunit alcohol dehydrogenase family)
MELTFHFSDHCKTRSRKETALHYDLAGKVALVTGGSRGIGAAVAQALASAGADVVITYLNSRQAAENVAAEMRAMGVRTRSVRADQADPPAAAAVVHQVADELGRLDIRAGRGRRAGRSGADAARRAWYQDGGAGQRGTARSAAAAERRRLFQRQCRGGVMEAAAARGLRVPDDLSVAGFDDIDVSRATTPRLTTVRQPLQEMGRTAVTMLMRQLDGHAHEALSMELETCLVVRESTGPASGPG